MKRAVVDDGLLPGPERTVLDAVERRLGTEARELLGAQRRRMGRVLRPRTLPHATLLGTEPGPTAWSPRVLFPRREEFLLATVEVRAGETVHSCEVVAVNGRVWAVLATPPLAPEAAWEVGVVRLGPDPMVPVRPGRRRSDGSVGIAAGGRHRGPAPWRVWTLLGGSREPGAEGSESPVVAVDPAGTLLVGRRSALGGTYRALVEGGPPVTLRARRLEDALREASRLSGA